MICDDNMSFEGIRPTICSKSLCIFRHEQFGLGVDLDSEIENHPDVVDLMITMAYTASLAETNSFDPFNPFPSGVEVKYKDKFTQEEITYDFLTNGQNDHSKVYSLIESIPPVSTLAQWSKKGILKEECFKISPLCYPFLRWVMASNRCHLKRLSKDKALSQMNTKLQYVLLSATPERDEYFQSEKKNMEVFMLFMEVLYVIGILL